MSYYQERCKGCWFVEDRVLKSFNKNRDTLALHEHVELVSVTFGVGSPNILHGDSGRQKSRRKLELLTLGLSHARVRSPDNRRKSRHRAL